MALTLATDTLCVVSVADAYLAGHPYGAGWASIDEGSADATLARKEALLRLASEVLSSGIWWNGRASHMEQPLAWPRAWMPAVFGHGGYISSTEIPTRIQQMTALLGLALHRKERTKDLPLKDFAIRQTGSSQFAGGAIRRVIPEAVTDMLPEAWGTVAGSGNLNYPLRRV